MALKPIHAVEILAAYAGRSRNAVVALKQVEAKYEH